MSLKGIIAISGMSGLYKVLAQAKNGFIVESIVDKKRFPIASSQRISALEDISVFTTGEDKPLKEVLLAMKENNGGNHSIDPKKADNKALKAFFKDVLPDFDEERVYISDIKKIIGWYGLLKDIVGTEEEVAPETAEAVTEEKPAAKKAKKEVAPEEEAEKPKKAAAPKKEKAAEAEPAAEKPAKAKAEPKADAAKKPVAPKAKKKSEE